VMGRRGPFQGWCVQSLSKALGRFAQYILQRGLRPGKGHFWIDQRIQLIHGFVDG